MIGMRLWGVLITCLIYSGTVAGTDLIEKIKQDESFVVPGLGAEKVLLDEDISRVTPRFARNSFKVSKPNRIIELFKDIFNLSTKVPIYFDAIYHNGEKKFSLFVFQNKVTAILGMNTNRITFDFVGLESGVRSFIFHYGNKDLNSVKNESHGIYYYPSKGIAVVDDNLNDNIDMYLIFKARKQNRHQEH